MSRKIVAGNWKMNLDIAEGNQLIRGIVDGERSSEVDVMVFPSHILVNEVSGIADGDIIVGVQNFYSEESGAYTGETSIDQAKSAGATIGLIGHSERRSLFGEDNQLLKDKVDHAIAKGFSFIFCCGEPLEIREANEEYSYVRAQLEESLFHISEADMMNCVIAYEPVWAIGTGKTATSDQAEQMHEEIRGWVREKYNEEIAESVTILYGGSCNPGNAKELFACPNVDGGLIGGAALKADSFIQIINSL